MKQVPRDDCRDVLRRIAEQLVAVRLGRSGSKQDRGWDAARASASHPIASEAMRRAYIAVINCSASVEEKIGSKHGTSLQQVRDAVQLPAVPVRTSWIPDTGHGRGPRLAVEGVTADGHLLRAVLYPVDASDGVWGLATALLVRRQGKVAHYG